MLLFRRFRREKEEPPEKSEPATGEPAPATGDPVENTPPTVGESPKPASSAPEVSGPARIPPPLPDRPAEPPLSAAPALDARSRCFVCGTPLEGRTCPTCRMTWVE